MESREDGTDDGAGLSTDALALIRSEGGSVDVIAAAAALPPPVGDAANRNTDNSTAKASRCVMLHERSKAEHMPWKTVR